MDFFCLAMGLVVLVVGLVFIQEYLSEKFERFSKRISENLDSRKIPVNLIVKELRQLIKSNEERDIGRDFRYASERKKILIIAMFYHLINVFTIGLLPIFINIRSIDEITAEIIEYDSNKKSYDFYLKAIERTKYSIERAKTNKNWNLVVDEKNRLRDYKQNSENLLVKITFSNFHF